MKKRVLSLFLALTLCLTLLPAAVFAEDGRIDLSGNTTIGGNSSAKAAESIRLPAAQPEAAESTRLPRTAPRRRSARRTMRRSRRRWTQRRMATPSRC